MPAGVDPNDIFYNGSYYNRNGSGGPLITTRNAAGQIVGLSGDNGAVLPLSRATTGNNIAIIGNSIVALGCLPGTGGAPASWVVNFAYVLNATVTSSVQDLTGGYLPLLYTCTTAGTSGTVEPVFSKVVNGTVTDGTAVWTSTLMPSAAVFWPPGWWHIAQGLSGQRLNEVFIVGRSGKTSDDVLNYLPRAMSTNPDIVFFATMFENDCTIGPSLAVQPGRWAAVVLAMDSVRAAGKRVMVQTVLPSGFIDASSSFTGYSRGVGTKVWQWLNAQIKDYARLRPDVIFFDAAAVYVDPNTANPVWPENAIVYAGVTTGKKTDGVHPTMGGAFPLGSALAQVLAANFPAVSHFGTATDVNYEGNNPLNFGTSGTSGVNVAAASVPNSMGLNAYGTAAVTTPTLVPRTDIAGNWMQANYNATVADNLNYSALGGIGLNNFVAGNIVQGFGEIKILANPVLLKQIYLRQDFSGTTQSSYSGTDAGSTAQDLGQMVLVDTIFTVKTVPMALPVGVTNIAQYAVAYGRTPCNYTIQYGRFSCVRLYSNPVLA